MDERNIFDEDFIMLLKKGDVNSYHQLYNTIAPGMRLVCLRYVKDEAEAEDVFHEGFIKIFSKVQTLKNTSLFLGWMKRIFINTALDFYQKKKACKTELFDNIIETNNTDFINEDIEISDIQHCEINYNIIRKVDFSENELINALNKIPEHFKIVFQLYAIDDFKHREISKMLNIHEKTSKTRLLRARALIKIELRKMAEIKLRNG